jgi:hypothetical protein
MLLRITFVVAAMLGGFGILGYVMLRIVLDLGPVDSGDRSAEHTAAEPGLNVDAAGGETVAADLAPPTIADTTRL